MALTDFFKKREEFNFREFRPREFPPEKKSFREKEKSRGDTRWVLGLLGMTVFLSIILWGWSAFGRREIGSTKPSPVGLFTSPTPIVFPRETKTMTEKIAGLTKSLKGSWGIYVYNLTTKESDGILSEEIFTAASLIKLPVLLTLYQETEAGRVNLETKYTLKQADKQTGAGSMQAKSAGTIYTYRQMAELMGKQSDNTAFNIMRKILGDQKIQETIDNLGMSKTSLARNETTPQGIGLFFRKLYGGSVVSREHRDEILSFLTDTAFEDRIPAGVPEGTRVAHKIGTEIGIFSDSGIVFAPKPFVLVILSRNAKELEAKTALPAITKAVWEFETK